MESASNWVNGHSPTDTETVRSRGYKPGSKVDADNVAGPVSSPCEPGSYALDSIDAEGVSVYSHASGYVPAFRKAGTCEVRLSAFADGTPAPVHVLEGLPATWVSRHGAAGGALVLANDVEAGFIRDGRFYTLPAAADVVGPGAPG
jgi:hypothetical protein